MISAMGCKGAFVIFALGLTIVRGASFYSSGFGNDGVVILGGKNYSIDSEPHPPYSSWDLKNFGSAGIVLVRSSVQFHKFSTLLQSKFK